VQKLDNGDKLYVYMFGMRTFKIHIEKIDNEYKFFFSNTSFDYSKY